MCIIIQQRTVVILLKAVTTAQMLSTGKAETNQCKKTPSIHVSYTVVSKWDIQLISWQQQTHQIYLTLLLMIQWTAQSQHRQQHDSTWAAHVQQTLDQTTPRYLCIYTCPQQYDIMLLRYSFYSRFTYYMWWLCSRVLVCWTQEMVLFITQLTATSTKTKWFSVLAIWLTNWWSLSIHISETRLQILTKLLHFTLHK